jgi:hypothetical protein
MTRDNATAADCSRCRGHRTATLIFALGPADERSPTGVNRTGVSPGQRGFEWSGAGSNRRPSAFQAGRSTRWYIADLQIRGPEWSGMVPSSVVDGSHLVSHRASRSFVVRTLEHAQGAGANFDQDLCHPELDRVVDLPVSPARLVRGWLSGELTGLGHKGAPSSRRTSPWVTEVPPAVSAGSAVRAARLRPRCVRVTAGLSWTPSGPGHHPAADDMASELRVKGGRSAR